MPAPPPPPARPAPAPAGGSPLPPIYPLPAPRGDRSNPAPRNRGRDTIVPPLPVRPSTHRARSSRAHANKPTPGREHASKQAGAKGRRDHTAPPPHQSANTNKRKHPHEHAPRVNTNPSHPQANTPTTSLLFHHPREHKKRPHSSVWAQPSVSATGEPWKSRRPARTKRRRPTRARRSKRTRSAQTTWFAPCAACARKGGQRERRPLTIAHARARGLLCLWACLRTFVGVFGLVGLGVWVFFGGVWRVFWFFDIFGL